MSISDLSSSPSPVTVLAEVVDIVRDLDATWWTTRSDDDLVATVELVQSARSALAAVEAGALAEADLRGLATQRLAYGSTGDWLTHLGGLRKGQGRRVVARAHALTGPLAATRGAMAAGRVSPEQAEVIVASVQALPSGRAVRRRGEATLLEQARSLDASDLARTGRHLVHVVDPDAEDRKLERQLAREERAAHHTRFLSLAFDGAGGVRLKGRGTAEDGAVLKAALLPLTTPAPAHHHDHHDDDHDGSHEPSVVLDPRDGGARMWDALVQTAQHALDTQLPPDTHGSPARLLVTTTLQALQTALTHTTLTGAAGVTGTGEELSAATLRRLACDAELVPAVLGSHGEPLDLGRARRHVTPALWAALVIRDRHCAFPACDRPPLMCHAHHIHHWTDGGPTTIGNLVLLCGHHHRLIHGSLGSPHQPPRPAPPVPTTTQTRDRTTLDQTPTTTPVTRE